MPGISAFDRVRWVRLALNDGPDRLPLAHMVRFAEPRPATVPVPTRAGRPRSLCWLLLSSLFLLETTILAAPPAPRVWPPSRAVTLSGKPLVVPTQLAPASVLVVGLTRNSREQTEPWSRRLRDDRRVVGASIYDVMVLDGVPGFVRSMIVKQVKSGVPRERHERFLVVSDDISAWRNLLDVKDEDAAYVALLNSKGAVVWRYRGALDDVAYRELLAHLE